VAGCLKVLLLFSYLCAAVRRIISLKGVFVGTQVCSGTKIPRKQLIFQHLLVYEARHSVNNNYPLDNLCSFNSSLTNMKVLWSPWHKLKCTKLILDNTYITEVPYTKFQQNLSQVSKDIHGRSVISISKQDFKTN
jgi:hypothetical protein